MSRDPGVANLILARLAELVDGQRRLERTLEKVANDTDALDRYNRPYGDGTRSPRGPRRGR